MSSVSGVGSGQQGLGMLAMEAVSGNAQADASKPSSGSDGIVPKDAATLTSLGAVMAQAVAGSDTNAAKVAALTEAIATGTYSVPASAVADKLLESMGR
ncbi:MAG: hypothetical protein JWM43_1205 [Acidobacteriaceae bacterium]|nr:hypothetical protein [Acidobacteriaceae bacterium]